MSDQNNTLDIFVCVLPNVYIGLINSILKRFWKYRKPEDHESPKA